MQVPNNIIIKDVSGKTVAYLSPKADGLKECYADCRLNGESTLEFMLPATSEKIDSITPECQIWANDRVYSLLKDDAIDTVRDDNNKLWSKFTAVERWKTDLEASFVEPYISNDPTTPTPADFAVIIVGGGTNLSGGTYPVGTAAHALYAILQGSGWSLGTCDVSGIHDLEAEKVSRLRLIQIVQETWGGYLVWDSVNKTVSLRDANKWQPYNGFQLRYAKNLKHITKTQSNRIVTKLYCFGHDDLDVASVNSGKKYITNFSYTPREYVDIYKNQDIYDPQELKEKATAELALRCRPRYLYRVKAVDLRTLPEYSHEDFSLGDMADVFDPDVAPNSPKVRIIRHKYNLFQPWKCELDLGDPEERLIEQLKASFSTSSFIGGKYNSAGKNSGHSIEDGTIHADKIVANSLVVGANVGLGTAQDAQGVTTIIGGTVTTDYIKTLGLMVGTHIQMGPNATISWSQVTGNKPTQYTDAQALSAWKNSGYATYINSSGVYSGSFNGGMFNINPSSDPVLESGLTIGGWFGSSWAGQALQLKYLPDGDLGAPGTVFGSGGGASLVFDLTTTFQKYVRFRGTSNVYFGGYVDFSLANVTGLNYVQPASGQQITVQVFGDHLEFRLGNGSYIKLANFSDL